MWTEIKDQTDIDKLLDFYSYFQDSCIRDIYISTMEFVDEKHDMHFDNTLSASLLFQREFGPLYVLELKFEEIERFNFRPFKEMEKVAIYEVTLLTTNGLFYWADDVDWKMGDNDSIWISGKKLFWRLRPELIGNINRMNGG